jgi:hypothetical protein
MCEVCRCKPCSGMLARMTSLLCLLLLLLSCVQILYFVSKPSQQLTNLLRICKHFGSLPRLVSGWKCLLFVV